jgi:KDO2-lipid IV(A) lauroyltransferase
VKLSPWLARLRNLPVHALTLGLLGVVRILPLRSSLALGGALAGLAWNMLPRWRRTALRNLELLYAHSPAWARPTHGEMIEIGRRAALSLGYEVIEFMYMGVAPIGAALRMIVEERGAEHLRQALTAGNGAIAIGLHYGNWELAGAWISQCIAPLHAVGKEQRDPFMTRLAFPWRIKYGIRGIVTGKQPSSALLRALKANEVLGLVSDQNGGRAGMFAPFCGIQASCAPGAAALALKTGAPLLAVYGERLGPGRIRCVCTPPVDMSNLPADPAAAQLEVQTRINSLIEHIVREDPGQWLLGHKRWRTRPAGEPDLYR